MAAPFRFPRRGGNCNNSSNAGLGYSNCNNARSNANANFSARPRSRSTFKGATAYESVDESGHGRGAFPSVRRQRAVNKNPEHTGIAVKIPGGIKRLIESIVAEMPRTA